MSKQGQSPRRPSRQIGNDLREWIMFLVAIGIVIWFAVRGSELNAWWIMLLGSMLGLSMLVAGVQQVSDSKKRRDDTEEGEEDETG